MPQYGKLKIDQFLYNDSGTDVTLDLANIASRGANTFTGNQSLGDNVKIIAGTGNDLEIYHNGSGSKIHNNTGRLDIEGDQISLWNHAGNEYLANFNADGAVELYWNGSKKLETQTNGITLTPGHGIYLADNGKIFLGAGNDLQIYYTGSAGWIYQSDSGNDVTLGANAGNVWLRTGASANDDAIKCVSDGAVELYWNGSKKFETLSNGNRNTGYLSFLDGSTNAILMGVGNDLQIYHNGTNSLIQNSTGYLGIQSDTLYLQDKANGHAYITGVADGAVGLRYDNSQKLETTSSGVAITGVLSSNQTSGQAISIGDNAQINLGTGDDLQIYHDGTDSRIDNNTGQLYIDSPGINIRGDNGNEDSIQVHQNGAVKLFYNGTIKFQTEATGVSVTSGHLYLTDNYKAQFGAAQDLQIYHNGSHSYVQNSTGWLILKSDNAQIVDGDAGDVHANFNHDGAVELFNDGVKKFETTSGGVNVVGALTVNGAALAGGGYASVQYFTSSGTWTKPSGIKTIRVTVIGAGGSGGRSNGIYAHGGDGGGAGGCAIETIDVTSVSSVSVTIGSGGAGQASPNNVGASGGSSSFGSYCSASGGEFGDYRDNQNLGGAGSGSGSGGDLNLKGGQGIKGLNIQNHSWQGSGGQAPVYGIVRSGTLSSGAGQGTSLSYGSGGAGACSGTSQAGSPGLVVVEEYK